MVDTPALRTAFFGGSLNPSASAISTFGPAGTATNVNRDIVVTALMTKGKNTGLQWDQQQGPGQPLGVDDILSGEIYSLIDKLVSGPTGSATNGTATVMKATCGAVLGSGTTLIQ